MNNIRLRIIICKSIIKELSKITDDPRQPEALAHYRLQLESLENLLPKPPPIVIGLKTASLSTRTSLGG